MRHALASLVLALFLFPSIAMGETVKYEELVITNGLYYKKFTNIPFTGKVTGKKQGSFKKGVMDGAWVEYNKDGRVSREVTYKIGKEDTSVGYRYHLNGQLRSKGTFKDGKSDGPWVIYHDNGQLAGKVTFKDGKRDGPWVGYLPDGTVWEEHTGTYKNDVKISD